MIKKYIILTASYWSWHNTAKDWIKKYLEENNNNVLVIDLVDLLHHSWFLTQKFYIFAAEIIPVIWYLTFKILDTRIINIFFKYYFLTFYSKKFNKLVNEYNPDYILSVYPFWQFLAWNYIKNTSKKILFWTFITDWTLSLPWYYDDKCIDKIFVIDSLTKADLEKKLNNRKNDIINTFFPIESKYFLDKNALWNKNIWILLSWLKDEFVINFLNNLNKESFYDNIILIKWRNDELYKKLLNTFNNKKFIFHTFLDIKNELKNIDIFITKPGWAIISECIAQDVYIISPSYIRWQEEWNINLIEKYKVWFYSENIDNIMNFLQKDYLNIDIKNFGKIKNKNSIADIINSLK